MISFVGSPSDTRHKTQDTTRGRQNSNYISVSGGNIISFNLYVVLPQEVLYLILYHMVLPSTRVQRLIRSASCLM